MIRSTASISGPCAFATRPQASLHHDAALRRDLELDLLDRLWERNEMSDDEATEVAVEAQHKTRPKRR